MVSSTEDLLRRRVHELLQCPINWTEITGVPDFPNNWLLFDWYRCLYESAVSSDERSVINCLAQFDILLIDECDEPLVKNLKMRMPEVRRLFRMRSERLSELRFLRPSHNGKHFRQNKKDEEIVKLSRTSHSLFFEDHTSEKIQRAFWIWFVDFFDTPITFSDYCQRNATPQNYSASALAIWGRFEIEPQFRIAVDCMRDLGAVKGCASRYVAFDVGLDARVVHAYPITQEEAEEIMHPAHVPGVRAFPFARRPMV